MATRSARSWNFSKCFWLFQWEKIIFCQNAYFCLKMIFRPCSFYFFFRTLGVGWVGFEKCGKFRTFFFLKPSLRSIFLGTLLLNVKEYKWFFFHVPWTFSMFHVFVLCSWIDSFMNIFIYFNQISWLTFKFFDSLTIT